MKLEVINWGGHFSFSFISLWVNFFQSCVRLFGGNYVCAEGGGPVDACLPQWPVSHISDTQSAMVKLKRWLGWEENQQHLTGNAKQALSCLKQGTFIYTLLFSIYIFKKELKDLCTFLICSLCIGESGELQRSDILTGVSLPSVQITLRKRSHW